MPLSLHFPSRGLVLPRGDIRPLTRRAAAFTPELGATLAGRFSLPPVFTARSRRMVATGAHGTLEYFLAHGALRWEAPTAEGAREPTAALFYPDAKARAIALEWVKTHDPEVHAVLEGATHAVRKTQYERGTAQGPLPGTYQQTTYHVVFVPTFGWFRAAGPGGKACVTLGPDDQVVAYYRFFSLPDEAEGRRPLHRVGDLATRLTRHPLFASLGPWDRPEVKVRGLGWWFSPPGERQPVVLPVFQVDLPLPLRAGVPLSERPTRQLTWNVLAIDPLPEERALLAPFLDRGLLAL